MPGSDNHGLPQSRSLDELVEFFDTHDMGELWNEMAKADLEVDVKRRTHLVAVDEEVAHKIDEMARARSVTLEALVDVFLRERIAAEAG